MISSVSDTRAERHEDCKDNLGNNSHLIFIVESNINFCISRIRITISAFLRAAALGIRVDLV
jgi:hypothetical protein